MLYFVILISIVVLFTISIAVLLSHRSPKATSSNIEHLEEVRKLVDESLEEEIIWFLFFIIFYLTLNC